MGKIVLVRHGETDWNNIGRIQGWTDVPLNSNGMKQADKTAKALQKIQITAVFSSPLKRALSTAEKIAGKHGVQTTVVPEFSEINQGLWEGLLSKEAKSQFPSLYKNWQSDPYNTSPPGGESVKMLAERVLPAYKRIKEHNKQNTVCIVSHKVVMALIKCFHNSIDFKEIMKFLPENADWEIL
jgi:alpha-ribazole phosphatase